MTLQTIDSSRAHDLPNLCADFFSLILHLRSQTDLGHPENLRKSLTQRFEAMERRAKEFRLDSNDVAEMKFALTAFLDETILNSNWRYKEVWRARPLQLEYFRTNHAGQEFFERLDHIWEDRKNKAALLEVYYLCLILGFEGKFKLQDKEKLYKLMNEIAVELGQTRSVAEHALSPNGQNPVSPRGRRAKRPPAWLIVLFCLFVGLLFYAIITELSLNKAGNTYEDIKKIKAKAERL